MNPTEQKNHKTAMRDLEVSVETFAAATEERMDGLDVHITQAKVSFAEQIGEERTHRLKLAEEQRGYVDNEDRLLRHRLDGFTHRGFWSRVNWLLTGR